MADYNKEIVKVLKDIATELHQLNKGIRDVTKAMEMKQFDEWIPPEMGTAMQNMKGCVMLNAVDFKKMHDVYLNKGETDDERTERTD